tara:strand:+ start:673 stop:1176 length:504 start_codon:yes stop_codon:yes gene_type:complete
MNEKKILRSNLNIKNENLKYTEDNISILNDLIKNKIICVYIPLKSEIDIINKLFGYQKILTTYLDNKKLKICKYKKPFKKNKLNVFEPETPSTESEVDVFLIPGLAFTVDGKRLGRGGGFYDKLLKIYPNSLKIGLTSNDRILNDIPTEDHDIFINYVFTNDKYYKS